MFGWEVWVLPCSFSVKSGRGGKRNLIRPFEVPTPLTFQAPPSQTHMKRVVSPSLRKPFHYLCIQNQFACCAYGNI